MSIDSRHTSISVWIPVQDADYLEDAARTERRSVSSLVREILAGWVRRQRLDPVSEAGADLIKEGPTDGEI